jgi:NhaA family Na+:H+ antiporter
MLKKVLKNFFQFTTSSEILLLFATISGLLIANSEFSPFYRDVFHQAIPFSFKEISFNFSPKLFIDDFLMAIFFLLIGLELKREIIVGELSSKEKIYLPVIAAIGGVIVPALIYIYFNMEKGHNIRGFAIPCATDIAFAYAVVKAFGNRISNSTKVFLVSLAVVDDLIAICIIAFFYTKDLQAINLLYSLFIISILFFLGTKKIQNISPYLFFGFILWIFIFKSGIHPSIAGVLLAMFIPFKVKEKFLLQDFAHKLSPFVGFVILPIFAFANSGVAINNFSWQSFYESNIILGIFFGLFFGKQVGVFLFSFIAVKLKICSLPKESNWLELYGAAILTGIGFTMSLFIGNLAFETHDTLDKVKIAVLAGSVASFLFGSAVLLMTKSKKK